MEKLCMVHGHKKAVNARPERRKLPSASAEAKIGHTLHTCKHTQTFAFCYSKFGGKMVERPESGKMLSHPTCKEVEMEEETQAHTSRSREAKKHYKERRERK